MKKYLTLDEISCDLKKIRETKNSSLRGFYRLIDPEVENRSFYANLLDFEQGRFPRNFETCLKGRKYFETYLHNLGFEEKEIDNFIGNIQDIQLGFKKKKDKLEELISENKDLKIKMVPSFIIYY